MVACLISRLHDTVQRVDGSGGDGGRDVQVAGPAGLLVYELKSFTGRVSARSPKRREQVEKSLATAAKLDPAGWSLVVPVDPNVNELAWFDGLRTRYPFPLVWLGRTWLDDQMADHPSLVRYYLRDADHEVLDVIVAAHAEQAALVGGAPDALERFRVLSDKLDEVSPHYRLDMSRSPDGVIVTAAALYPGAEFDAPITVETQLAFDDTPAGEEASAAFAEFLDYGGEFQASGNQVLRFAVGAPAGLGGDFAGGAVRMASLPMDTHLPLPARVEVLAAGRPIASLPLAFRRRTTGRRGGVLTGSDPTGGVDATLRFDLRDHRQNLRLSWALPPDLLPAALMPMLRFVDALARGDQLALSIAGRRVGDPQAHTPTEWVDHGFVSLLERLVKVQDATATPFALPEVLTAEDVWTITKAATLLEGGVFEEETEALEIETTVAEAAKIATQVAAAPAGVPFTVIGEVVATICGHDAWLGRVASWFADGVLRGAGGDPATDPESSVTLSVVSPSGARMRSRMLADDETPVLLPDGSAD